MKYKKILFALGVANVKKLRAFVKNKKAYYSLVILTVVLLISCFAKIIANDKPLLIKTDSRGYFFPILFDYTLEDFGDNSTLIPNYKDPYFQDLVSRDGGVIIFPLLPYSFNSVSYNPTSSAPHPPSLEHPLGTDDVSRDTLTRIIYGLGISMAFGLALTIITSSIGIIVGAIQGYFGGAVDLLSQRLIEIYSSLPVFYILITLSAFVEFSFTLLLTIMILINWMTLVPLVRAEFLKIRYSNYALAAKALGMNNKQIIFKHVLPNALSATLSMLPFILSGAVISLSALDFLGIGLSYKYPSLGEIIEQGQNNVDAPWIGISIFLVLSFIIALLIFIGEGIRDALNTRKL